MQVDRVQISNPLEPKVITATDPLCSSLSKYREQGKRCSAWEK